jgi:hypothetical protein
MNDKKLRFQKSDLSDFSRPIKKLIRRTQKSLLKKYVRHKNYSSVKYVRRKKSSLIKYARHKSLDRICLTQKVLMDYVLTQKVLMEYVPTQKVLTDYVRYK